MKLVLNTWHFNAGMNKDNAGEVFDTMDRVFDENEIPSELRGATTFAVPGDLELADIIRGQVENRNYGTITYTGFNPKGPEIVTEDGHKDAIYLMNQFGEFTLQGTPEGMEPILSGPSHTSHLTKIIGGTLLDPETQQYLVSGLKEVAQANPKVTFAFETLQRGESYVLSTNEDAVYILKKVEEPNVGINYDIVHVRKMKGPDNVVPDLKWVLDQGIPINDVHVCEDDRLEFGRGDMGAILPQVLSLLHGAGYKKGVLPEGFESGMDGLVGITERDATQQDYVAVASRGIGFVYKEMQKQGIN